MGITIARRVITFRWRDTALYRVCYYHVRAFYVEPHDLLRGYTLREVLVLVFSGMGLYMIPILY